MRRTVKRVADGDVGERRGVGRDVVGPGIGLPCGQVVGLPSRRSIACSTASADHVLPLPGLVVGLGPRQLQDVGEEALGEAVAAHDPLGERRPGVGEADAGRRCVTRPSASSRRDHLAAPPGG